VERATHCPGLHEPPPRPQRVADVVATQAVEAGVELELREAHHLGLDPDVLGHDIE